MKTKIVGVKFIEYNERIYNALSESGYYLFKSNDDLKINDVVLCYTNGDINIGVVRKCVEVITTDELFDSDLGHKLWDAISNNNLGECKLLPNFTKIVDKYFKNN